jgi:hypothetical protein
MKNSNSRFFLSGFDRDPAANLPGKTKKIGAALLCIAALALTIVTGIWIVGLSNQSSSAQTLPDFSSLEPKDVVDMYWFASLDGKSETLKGLITSNTPESFYRECPAAESKTLDSAKPMFTLEPADQPIKQAEPKTYPKLFGTIEKDSVPDLIYEMSYYINVTRESLSKYEYTRQEIYEDEAVVELTRLKDPQDDSTHLVYLTKEPSGWKIFTIYGKSMSRMIGNQKFGQKRFCDVSKKAGV